MSIKEEILNLIMQLGNHYASAFSMDEDRNVKIDRLLTDYYGGSYDITEILKEVSNLCKINQIKLRSKCTKILRKYFLLNLSLNFTQIREFQILSRITNRLKYKFNMF